MIRLICVFYFLVGSTSALAQPASTQNETANSKSITWGVRALVTSTELTANILNAHKGTGYGVAIDFQRDNRLNVSLEFETIDYTASGRSDKRVRIRERFRYFEMGRIFGYGLLGAGLTFAEVNLPQSNTKGVRLDAEAGMGFGIALSDQISVFAETALGIGEWIDEPRSALAESLETTSEGFGDIRAGVQIRF